MSSTSIELIVFHHIQNVLSLGSILTLVIAPILGDAESAPCLMVKHTRTFRSAEGLPQIRGVYEHTGKDYCPTNVV